MSRTKKDLEYPEIPQIFIDIAESEREESATYKDIETTYRETMTDDEYYDANY